MRHSFLIALFLAVALAAGAQESPDWYLDQPIVGIQFVGLSSVSAAELDPITRPYINETFTERRFLELQRRLYALDFFTAIVPEAVRPESGDGVIVQFTVTERPTVDEIQFEGNRKVRTSDLLSAVLLKPGDMITLTKRRLDEQAALDLYLERGYPDVGITSRVDEVATVGDPRYIVVFEVSEGKQVTIREIRFSGNTFASASTLRGQMNSKSQNIFSAGVFQNSVLEEDRLRIEEYYRVRGYVDAKVLDVSQEYERDEEADRMYLILTLFIEEGSQYTFGGVEFSGNTIFTDEELRELVRVRDGAILNSIRLAQGIGLVQDLYYQNGYIFNAFNISEERDEQNLSIKFTLTVAEQVRAHIEHIIVRGNSKTQDHVILRELPLLVGDVFGVNRIREGIQNLTNLQFFSAINPETPQGSVEGLMDLVINVEEAQTADIRFGVSFGGNQEFPVSAQVGWSDVNFRGAGQTLGFDIQVSPIEQLLSVNFLESWFTGRRWSLGAELSVSRSVRSGVPQDILYPIFQDDDINAVPDPYEGYYVFSRTTKDNDGKIIGTEYPAESGTWYLPGTPFPDTETLTEKLISDYDLVTDYVYAGGLASIPNQYLMSYTDWSIGLGGTTGYRFRTPIGSLSLSTQLSSSLNWVGYEPTQFRPFESELRANLRTWQLINKWSLRGVLDRRFGQVLSPSNGYVFSQGLTFTGGFLFGDRHYIRTDTTAEGYVTLFDIPASDVWNWKLVLAAHSDISFILPTFWAPEPYHRRPLDEDDNLHPLDATKSPLAGTDLLATNGMFIARGWDPVTGGEALWNNWLELRMPIFESVLWLDSFFDAVALWEDPAEIVPLGIEDVLFGFGAGIRFTIPQFPIRLYLAKRFKFDGAGALQWQQGELFNWDGSETGGLDFVFAIGAGFF